LISASQIHLPSLEVYHGDILKTDWSDADILYISSVCFSEVLLSAIGEQTKNLKKGSRVLTLQSFTSAPHLEMEFSLMHRMSWG
jgi:hypothetical protein